MPDIEINRFISYKLSEKEELQGSVFTPEQKACLQNLLSRAALDKQALAPDPNNIQPFIQQEAFLKGQIELLEYILQQSDYAEEALLELSRNSAQAEQQEQQDAMSVFNLAN